MFGRTLLGLMGATAILAVETAPVDAQLSGRIVLNEGPIAVDVVFGPQYRATDHRRRVVRGAARAPVRYRAGMSMRELELYLDRIEYEYDLYRRMDPRDAYYDYGWTRHQLRDYVRFLRDERKFLRAEHKRLHRLYRADGYRIERPGRGQGRGRGRGLRAGRGRNR